MKDKIKIFDRGLINKNRARYKSSFDKYNFLYKELVLRIVEDIALFGKFENILEINPYDDFFLKKLASDNLQYSAAFLDNEEKLNIDLELNNEKFDLIVSILDLHYINDITSFLGDVKKILKKNGYFIAIFFGESNLFEISQALYKTSDNENGIFYNRMPPTIDVKTAADLVSRAGYRDPISDVQKIELLYDKVHDLLRDIKYMSQGNCMSMRPRKFMTKEFFNNFIRNYEENNFIDDKFIATFEVITLIGLK